MGCNVYLTVDITEEINAINDKKVCLFMKNVVYIQLKRIIFFDCYEIFCFILKRNKDFHKIKQCYHIKRLTKKFFM